MNFEGELNISRASLRTLLRQNEIIPDKHRLTVWKTMLQLPANKKEYLDLRQRGKKVPLDVNMQFADENLQKISCRVLQTLLTHSPSLIQMKEVLTCAIQGFAAVFASSELAFFEAMLTIIVNFCQHWFDCAPDPPYSLMSLLDIIMLVHEPLLYRHLVTYGIRNIDFSWKWMMFMFTSVVDSSEWLILWDHILCNEPDFICFIPLATIRILSRHLMAKTNKEDIMCILNNSAAIDAQTLVQETYKLQEINEIHTFPASSLHNFSAIRPGVYPTLSTNDVITFNSNLILSENIGNLLSDTEKIEAQVDRTISEGLALRKYLIEM